MDIRNIINWSILDFILFAIILIFLFYIVSIVIVTFLFLFKHNPNRISLEEKIDSLELNLLYAKDDEERERLRYEISDLKEALIKKLEK